MKTFVTAVKKETVDTDKMWEAFEKEFPQYVGVDTYTWAGNGLPDLPCIEVFCTSHEPNVLFCTKEQAKILDDFNEDDVIADEPEMVYLLSDIDLVFVV